jgi:hypothetical protein
MRSPARTERRTAGEGPLRDDNQHAEYFRRAGGDHQDTASDLPAEEQRPDRVPASAGTLKRHQALKVDCADVEWRIFLPGLPASYAKGYVTIESATRLDVRAGFRPRRKRPPSWPTSHRTQPYNRRCQRGGSKDRGQRSCSAYATQDDCARSTDWQRQKRSNQDV